MTADRQSGQRIVLRRHPKGVLQASDFSLEAQPAPEIGDNELLIRNVFVSVDPMLRLVVDSNPLGGAFPPLPLGATIPGAAVGEVVESRHPDFRPGDLVEGRFGWQHFAVSKGVGVNRVNPGLAALEHALGVGGLPGFTAYVGLHAAGLKPGQTMLVSGAAGAVGSIVGPMARARGLRVVGIAGGAAKCRYLVEEAGYDAAADRTSPDFLAQLKTALPEGAHAYFDNVGGPLLAAMIPVMARGCQVLISGLMAQYQDDASANGPDHLPAVLQAVMGWGVRIFGFSQHGQEHLRPAFEAEIAAMIASGQIKPVVHVMEGIEQLPQALLGLFSNGVTGKVVVRVAELPVATQGERV